MTHRQRQKHDEMAERSFRVIASRWGEAGLGFVGWRVGVGQGFISGSGRNMSRWQSAASGSLPAGGGGGLGRGGREIGG